MMGGLETWAFMLTLGVTFFGGFVKGAVGFAMPLVMVSVLSSFLTHDLVLASVMLPILVTNLSQCLRDGWRAAADTAWQYRRMIGVMLVFILISAQFVDAIPHRLLTLLLGVPITLFALVQLLGIPLALRLEHRGRAEVVLGVIGGFYGGIAGIWGPPLIVYLLSIDAEKREAMRVQGVFFFLGSIVLLAGHFVSGLLTPSMLVFSGSLVLPAVAGMALGYAVHDRLPGPMFRRCTQAMLVLTGLNLVREALV